jgi:hypothetical protein
VRQQAHAAHAEPACMHRHQLTMRLISSIASAMLVDWKPVVAYDFSKLSSVTSSLKSMLAAHSTAR